MSDKSWELAKLANLQSCKLAKLALSHSLTLDMLNNFCFHVYAQKSLSHSLTLTHSHTISISHSITLDMLNNYCFHVYAQKSLSHSHTLSHSLTDTLTRFQSLIHLLSTC